MRATMMDMPLTIPRSCATGPRCTATARSSRRPAGRGPAAAYGELGATGPRRPPGRRAAQPRRRRRPARRHPDVEQRRAPRGLPGHPLDGRGPAHPQPAPGPRRSSATSPSTPGTRSSSSTATLVPLLATVLPHAPSIRHIVDQRSRTETRSADLDPSSPATAARCTPTRSCSPASPDGFDWPELDERSAAAMCYTSGTTGHPKGVVYSHRSMHLHSMAVAMGNVFGLSDRDRVLPVVPMFHANAWGLPYAAVMAGADCSCRTGSCSPRRWPRMIEAERPTLAGAVPTIWNGLLQHVRANGGDLSSLRLVPCGGSAVPHALMEAYEKELGVTIVQAWGMTETSPLGSVARPPAGLPEDEAWHYRDTQGRLMCQVEGRLVGDERHRAAQRRRGRRRGRGPRSVGHRQLLQGRRSRQVPRRLAAHRRRRHHRPARLRHAHRPGQGRDQVRRRVDLLHGAGERADGPPARRPRRPSSACPTTSGASGRWPPWCWPRTPRSSADELRAFLAERVPRWQLPERWSFIAEVPKTSVGKFAKTTMREAYARGDYLIIEAR